MDTPGPIGLAGLIIARILKLPVSGTYKEIHREFSVVLSEDEFTEDIFWKYMQWFYSQMDDVYVGSAHDRAELMHRGIASEKIRIFPAGRARLYSLRSYGHEDQEEGESVFSSVEAGMAAHQTV